jgi:UDP-glucose 4-epimerase
MGDALTAEQPWFGRPREGKRRVLVSGVHRKVAGEFVTRLVADPEVEFVVGVSHGTCPAPLLDLDPDRFLMTTADLSRREQVENLFMLDRLREANFDTVVHLAFQGNPKGYSVRRHEFNVNSTRWLLDGCLRREVGKFIYLSTDAVYEVGPRSASQVREDADVNFDPQAHPIVRDTVDAEFSCRAKMDHDHCEIVVLRPSGVLGGGVLSGLNLLMEGRPPLLPVGYDPLINPTSKQRLGRDLHLAATLRGKGLFNVAGPVVATLEGFMEARGISPQRVPGPLLTAAGRVQRVAGRSRYNQAFHPGRLFYSLVLDDTRFDRCFRVPGNEHLDRFGVDPIQSAIEGKRRVPTSFADAD